MTLIIIELVIVFIGLVLTPVLFYHFPKLPQVNCCDKRFPSLSVIIPARNEEKNIKLLLGDLITQSIRPLEIILVDDDSSDATARIAKSFGVSVISLHNKPFGWTGKTWACQNGADSSKGDLLLFLDADVRLGKTGIERLLLAYSDSACTISVQPYHKTDSIYEQFSIIFNLVQIAANGTSLPTPRNSGLYGPVILISKTDYGKEGGHKSVQKCIVEDMALGQRLKETSIPYRLFVGDKEIYFRMYGGGFRSLFKGWVKNISSGAAKTPGPVLLMVIFWIASLTSVPVHIAAFAFSGNMFLLNIYSFLYFVWTIVLYLLSKKIGHFKLVAIVFYPLLVITFISVFFVSLFKRLFGLKVIWKDRAIGVEDKKCR